MKYVNILTSSNFPVFLRQLDQERYGKDFLFFENSNEDIVWDYIVVYEEIKKPITLKCKKGGLIFFSGESSDSRYYGKSFLDQFDAVIATHGYIKHKNFINSQIALNWHYGFSYTQKTFSCNYLQLAKALRPIKTKNISIITSSLCMMPGHLKRLRFIEKILQRYQDKIDIFGKGVKFIDDKADALNDYMFHICLENTKEKNYWSEKLSDPILGFSIPIYYGDPSVADYFNTNGFFQIDIDKPEEAFRIIDKILSNPVKYYNEKIEGLCKMREKLLNEYNFFPVFEKIIQRLSLKGQQNITILPCYSFFDSKIGILKLRIYRFLFNKLHRIKW